ncbi:PQQ-dependent sugar dehydrogenase [Alteraurantiacibacter aestuarii]|uniref:PQQ-dependent sugar dehydrogenase n=1 Tax=Alteraurantiacibacter aestuarii TaxID=650004 RepID=A0A844ZQ72_9SPHN|nr:PQQ-dependent sugar dehydrogenase [Alteraurantiacibacter aestuarii]MXO87759.1 PQQ-dependent sugar dehydrogenase [Alteraurantiacibacter aestuarii]
MKGLKALAAVSALAMWSAAAMAQDAPAAPPPGPPPFQGTDLATGPWSFQTAQADFDVDVVARGLDHPWGLAFLPDGGMLVTERPGRLRLIRNGVLDPTPISGLPDVFAVGIAGLMDIALHPDFAENGLVYMAYSKNSPDGKEQALAVMRARWDGAHALTNVEDIFVSTPWYGSETQPERCCGQGPAFGSFGGRILFDPDGYLYITSGDRNYGELVRDPSNHIGKILRLNDDGSVPAGNPWVGLAGHASEVWSTGHRNPLGLTYNTLTGEIWESEFGPRGGDEVNRITRGGDYGWITVTQGFHYDGTQQEGIRNRPGMIDPVLVYGPPSLNPGNLAFYDGTQFANWHGDLFLASFTQGLLRYDTDVVGMPRGEPEILLKDLGQRWRDVRNGPDGNLYVLSDMADGVVLRISPAN